MAVKKPKKAKKAKMTERIPRPVGGGNARESYGEAEREFERDLENALANPSGDTSWVDELPEEPNFEAGDTAVIFVKDKKKKK